MNLTEKSITELLKAKHAEDIFVPQCKGGPSGGGLAILDAWAMKKSWANPLAIGYEIKVSRRDFVQDDKWQKYLPMCHQLYFVTPYGLVQPDEVPEGVGLMWVAKTGSMIYTKKKASRRDIPWPAKVMAYVLMSRVEIDPPNRSGIQSKDSWKRWLEAKRKNRDLGYDVAYRLKSELSQRVLKAEQAARDAENRAGRLERMAAKLEGMGIDPVRWGWEEKIEGAVTGIPSDIVRMIDRLKERVDEFRISRAEDPE